MARNCRPVYQSNYYSSNYNICVYAFDENQPNIIRTVTKQILKYKNSKLYDDNLFVLNFIIIKQTTF